MVNHIEAGDRVCILCPTSGLSHHIKAIAEYKSTMKMPDIDAFAKELGRS
jgi:hypothetical protein